MAATSLSSHHHHSMKVMATSTETELETTTDGHEAMGEIEKIAAVTATTFAAEMGET